MWGHDGRLTWGANLCSRSCSSYLRLDIEPSREAKALLPLLPHHTTWVSSFCLVAIGKVSSKAHGIDTVRRWPSG